MNTEKLIKLLSKTREPRATMYLNEDDVSSLYNQSISQIEKIIVEDKIDGKISLAGLLEFGGGMGMAGEAAISKFDKAILIEYYEQSIEKLVDLKTKSADKGKLLLYIGACKITLMDEDVNVFPDQVNQIIQTERAEQEKLIRFEDDARRTIVLTFKLGDQHFASIGNSKYLDFGKLGSYRNGPAIGISGRLEKQIENVLFIDPLWIWHDGW